MARLRALRAALPWEDMARSRAEAPLRRLFDPSHEAILLRRYETAAAREMHKILEQFERPVADEEPENPIATIESPTACEELASFRNPEETDPAAQDPMLVTLAVFHPGPIRLGKSGVSEGRGRDTEGTPRRSRRAPHPQSRRRGRVRSAP